MFILNINQTMIITIKFFEREIKCFWKHIHLKTAYNTPIMFKWKKSRKISFLHTKLHDYKAIFTNNVKKLNIFAFFSLLIRRSHCCWRSSSRRHLKSLAGGARETTESLERGTSPDRRWNFHIAYSARIKNATQCRIET